MASVCAHREDEDAPTPQEAADARLIAKAPEMVELLQEYLDTHPCPSGRESRDCDECIRARALLAEVKGE